MTTIVEQRHLAAWGCPSRTRRIGPERDLVEWFLERMPVRIPSGHRLSIFQEPKLESGFPDLVLVVWDQRRTLTWSSERAQLTSSDLTIAHCIYEKQQTTAYELERLLGPGIDEGLERLRSVGVVSKRHNKYQLMPLRTVFAVSRIIAIEAKISDLASGFAQAALNTWFADDSHLLIPGVIEKSHGEYVPETMKIGILTKCDTNVLEPKVTKSLPRSYASWLFNEWAWRASLADEHY